MFSSIEDLLCTEEKSIVNIEELVKWKKSKKLYNFDVLPETAILTMFPRKKNFFSLLFKRPIGGIKGRHFLIKEKKVLLCTECGYGAPYIISLCEELRVLGVRNFIFIGLAGTLTSSFNEGELLFVEKAFSGSGASYYYNKEEVIVPRHSDWTKRLIDKINIRSTNCWSTDAPFRESISLKKYYEEKGAEIVEMECAAIYSFANYYKLNACCFAIISDKLTDTWCPPQYYERLVNKEREIISRIVNLV